MLVDIVPVGEVTPRVKREASAALRSVYDCDVTVHDDQPIPGTAYDEGRDQYRAEDLIETVAASAAAKRISGSLRATSTTAVGTTCLGSPTSTVTAP